MMLLARHIQVHDGQGHENESLQRDNQDMEYCPAELQQPTERTQRNAAAVHQRDQDNNHFAGVHVSEQTLLEINGFGDNANAYEHQVDRRHEFGQWLECQFTDETANRFNIDASVTSQPEHEPHTS